MKNVNPKEQLRDGLKEVGLEWNIDFLEWTTVDGRSLNEFMEKQDDTKNRKEAAEKLIQKALKKSISFSIVEPMKFKESFNISGEIKEMPNSMLEGVGFSFHSEDEKGFEAFQRDPNINFTLPRTQEEVEFVEKLNPGFQLKRMFAGKERIEKENVNIVIYWVLEVFKSDEAERIKREIEEKVNNLFYEYCQKELGLL